jgi:hypothetical protein
MLPGAISLASGGSEFRLDSFSGFGSSSANAMRSRMLGIKTKNAKQQAKPLSNLFFIMCGKETPAMGLGRMPTSFP